MLPTTKVRTRYALLQDGRKFALTQSQYEMLRSDKDREKATKIFELYDADTKELLFEGEYRAIKEFPKISQGKSNFSGYYCGYGNLHGMQEECNCFKKYKVSEHKFRSKAYELYGKFEMVHKIVGAEETLKKQYYPLYLQDLSYVERNNCIELCK